MPVVVKDFTWNETEKMVFVSVPLKGVRPQKVDIFSTEDYLKVHYPPYLFDCWLYGEVFDQNSVAQVGNGEVIFKLEKHESGLWGQLQHPDAGDKEKAKEHREAAIKRAQERTEQQKKEKAEKKREIEKYAVNEQMRLEQSERDWRKGVKDAEVNKATEELEHWKEDQRVQAEKEKQEQLRKKYTKEVTIEPEPSKEESSHSTITNGKQSTENGHKPPEEKKEMKKKKGNQNIFVEAASGQPLRESAKISVSFTPRVFPTAARESTAPEEQEWLKKQAEARRINEIADSELSEHERDPVWLRDKGNDFFKKGNFPAAINVYSHAIRMNHMMPALYSNRGACHLKLGNYFKCIEDTSKALELLTPPVQMNAASRLRAHTRRGTALCQLEMYVEGLMDYDAALKIDPKNESLIQDADRIRAIIQGSKPTPDTSEL